MDAPLPPPQKPTVPLNPALLWVGGGSLLLFVCGLFVLFILITRTEPLAQRVVREAKAFEGAAWPRPSHFSPPVPGRFADALAPLLPELENMTDVAPHELTSPSDEGESYEESAAYSEAYDKLEEQCRAVSRGVEPLETVPWECLQVLHGNRGLLHRVLAATRAEVGGLPEGLGSLSRPADMLDPFGINLLKRMSEMAALEIQVLLSWGRTQEAVDTCMDGLALSREASLGGGLYGRQLSVTCHDILFLPCAAALDAALPERLPEARAQLARLREGYPPLSAVLREESVYQQLSAYGDLLSSRALDALPEAGQQLASESSLGYYYDSPSKYPRLRPYAWRRNAALFEAMVAVADLPAEQRRKAFSSIDTRHGTVPENLAWRAQDYSDQADNLAPQELQALALSAIVEVKLARAEQGTWPQVLPPALAGTFALAADTELEAWLVPLDPISAVPELRLTVPLPPSPRPRYAGGVFR
jgi:hypothetical protein